MPKWREEAVLLDEPKWRSEAIELGDKPVQIPDPAEEERQIKGTLDISDELGISVADANNNYKYLTDYRDKGYAEEITKRSLGTLVSTFPSPLAPVFGMAVAKTKKSDIVGGFTQAVANIHEEKQFAKLFEEGGAFRRSGASGTWIEEQRKKFGLGMRGLKGYGKAFVDTLAILRTRSSAGIAMTDLSVLGERIRMCKDAGLMGEDEGIKEYLAIPEAEENALFGDETIEEHFQRREMERTQKTIGFNSTRLPPPEDIPEQIVDIGTNVAAFITKLGLLKKALGTPSPGRDIVAWEVVNEADGGTPGKGAAMYLALKGIDSIPIKGAKGFVGKTSAQSGLFAGIAASSGGDKTDIIAAAMLPWALRATDAATKGVVKIGRTRLETRTLKNLREIGKNNGVNLSDVPDNTLRFIMQRAKQARFWNKQYAKGKVSEDVLNARLNQIRMDVEPALRAIARQQPTVTPTTKQKQEQAEFQKQIEPYVPKKSDLSNMQKSVGIPATKPPTEPITAPTTLAKQLEAKEAPITPETEKELSKFISDNADFRLDTGESISEEDTKTWWQIYDAQVADYKNRGGKLIEGEAFVEPSKEMLKEPISEVEGYWKTIDLPASEYIQVVDKFKAVTGIDILHRKPPIAPEEGGVVEGIDISKPEGRKEASIRVTARAKEIAEKLGFTVSEDELLTTVEQGTHSRGTSHGDAGISMFLAEDVTQEQIDRILIHELGHIIKPSTVKGISNQSQYEKEIQAFEEEQITKLKELEAPTPQPKAVTPEEGGMEGIDVVRDASKSAHAKVREEFLKTGTLMAGTEQDPIAILKPSTRKGVKIELSYGAKGHFPTGHLEFNDVDQAVDAYIEHTGGALQFRPDLPDTTGLGIEKGEYIYESKARPVGIGTVPKQGHIGVEEGGKYSRAIFNRPLTEQELSHYDLVPVEFRPLTPTPQPKAEAKQPWEMTREEFKQYLVDQPKLKKRTIKLDQPELMKAGRKEALRQGIEPGTPEFGLVVSEEFRKQVIQKALSENKPVPRSVLEEYKSEKWAQEALAKTEGTQVKKYDKKEFWHYDLQSTSKATNKFLRENQDEETMEKVIGDVLTDNELKDGVGSYEGMMVYLLNDGNYYVVRNNFEVKDKPEGKWKQRLEVVPESSKIDFYPEFKALEKAPVEAEAIIDLFNKDTKPQGNLERGLDYYRDKLEKLSDEDLKQVLNWARQPERTPWIGRFVRDEIAGVMRSRGLDPSRTIAEAIETEQIEKLPLFKKPVEAEAKPEAKKEGEEPSGGVSWQQAMKSVLDLAEKDRPRIRKEQKKTLSERVGAQAGTLEFLRKKGVGGKEAIHKSAGKLKGALTNYEGRYQPLAEILPPWTIEAAENDMADSDRLTPLDRISLTNHEGTGAWDKMLRGAAMTPGDVRLIRKWQPELAKEAAKRVPLSNRVWSGLEWLLGTLKFGAAFDIQMRRQARWLRGRHPILFSKAVGRDLAAYISKKYADRMAAETEASPYHSEESGFGAKRHGLRFLPRQPLSSEQRPEQFVSNLPTTLPWLGKRIGTGYKYTGGQVGRVYAASMRGFVDSFNWMQQKMWDMQIEKWKAHDIEITPKMLHDLVDFQNTMLGMSKPKTNFGGAVNRVMRPVMWSPSLTWSRIRTPSLMISNPTMRKEIAASLSTYIGTGLMYLAAATLLGRWLGLDDLVEWDTNSSDFGKIKWGDTRWDVFGDGGPYIRAILQAWAGTKKNQAGRVTTKEGFERLDPFKQLLRNKRAPALDLFAKIWSGRNYYGGDAWALPDYDAMRKEGGAKAKFADWHEKQMEDRSKEVSFFMSKEVYDRYMPFFIQSTLEAAWFDGWPQALGAGTDEFFSGQALTYEPSTGSELQMVQDIAATQKYDKLWDDLTPGQQERLYDDVPEMEQLETKKASEKLPPEEISLTRQNRAAKRIFKAMPDDIKKEMNAVGAKISAPSRKIGKFFLNEKRYDAYEEYTRQEIEEVLSKAFGRARWKRLSDTEKLREIKEDITDAKADARGRVLREIDNNKL